MTPAVLLLAALAQTPRPEILILGTYHMANPGHDIHNVHADDVLAPERQQQITELLDVLKRFHPTKIAIESDPGGPRPQQYAAYLAGTYTLTRNEIDQLGFRLAKQLGQQAIYPVDADGDFPIMRVENYAKANNRTAEFAAIDSTWAKMTTDQESFLRSHTILETLAYLNADSLATKNVATYFRYVPLGEPWDFAGPDLLAAWYQRNIRIYHNITALITSPSDRILVIFGSGHLGWLRQDVANDPRVQLRTLADLK